MKALTLGFLAATILTSQAYSAEHFSYSDRYMDGEPALFTEYFEAPVWINHRGQKFEISESSDLDTICRELGPYLTRSTPGRSKIESKIRRSTIRKFSGPVVSLTKEKSFVSTLACSTI